MSSSPLKVEVVYAQKLLNRDSRRLTCDNLREKNEKYLGCEDGWTLKGDHPNFDDHRDDHDDDHRQHHRHQGKDDDEKTMTKFRQVWIQGFVVEYVESKDWLLVDDGTGSPWTVVHAAKNPTSVKWLKKSDGSFDADKKFYVLVLGELVVPRDGKERRVNEESFRSFHVAAVKVQDLTSRLPSYSLQDLDDPLRAEIESVVQSLNSSVESDAEKIQLYQWMLEVEHMQLRSRLIP